MITEDDIRWSLAAKIAAVLSLILGGAGFVFLIGLVLWVAYVQSVVAGVLITVVFLIVGLLIVDIVCGGSDEH